MGALITVVKNKKKELVILNRNFTKEELRSKLSGTILYPESWIEYVLEKGIFIPKDFIVVVKTDKNTSIENPVGRWHKHDDSQKPRNDGKRPISCCDCNKDNCKHRKRNHNVRHRIAFPYCVFDLDFFRNYPQLLSPPSLVSVPPSDAPPSEPLSVY